VRSGLISVISQRLLRVLCSCARESTAEEYLGTLDVEKVRVPVGCPQCNQTGFQKRAIITEYLDPRPAEVGQLILRKADSRELYQAARENGMATLLEQATELVRSGQTSPSEIWRVLGSATRV